MSLGNVLLVHVSTMFAPPTKEEEQEYYALLEIPKYSNLAEIRKGFRKVTLRQQCDKMMLEWNAPQSLNESSKDDEGLGNTTAAFSRNNQRLRLLLLLVEQHEKALAALEERSVQVREAFRILGDRHLRQQYHLLQCRPSRYRMIRGPMRLLHWLTSHRKWFPLLVLQSVVL